MNSVKHYCLRQPPEYLISPPCHLVLEAYSSSKICIECTKAVNRDFGTEEKEVLNSCTQFRASVENPRYRSRDLKALKLGDEVSFWWFFASKQGFVL